MDRESGTPEWGVTFGSVSLEEVKEECEVAGIGGRTLKLYESILVFEIVHQLTLKHDYLRMLYRVFDGAKEDKRTKVRGKVRAVSGLWHYVVLRMCRCTSALLQLCPPPW